MHLHEDREQAPLVTVVTVCFNDLARLPHTIESVVDQRLPQALEHIVIDGDSDDGTKGWATQWASAGPRRRFVSEPDVGIFDAMNKGLRLASGRYVVYLNAGDAFVSAGALDTAVRHLVKGGAAWGYGLARIVDAHGLSVRPDIGTIPYSRRNHLYGLTTICHQAVLMEREMLVRLGGFDHGRFGLASDYALLLRAAGHESPVTWPHAMVTYEIGGASETDIYRQLWRRHRARAGCSGSAPPWVDALWTMGQIARVASGKVARRLLVRLGIRRLRGRDLVALEGLRN